MTGKRPVFFPDEFYKISGLLDRHVGTLRILFRSSAIRTFFVYIRSGKEMVYLRLNMIRCPEVVSSP
jgi:hypothetical protein